MAIFNSAILRALICFSIFHTDEPMRVYQKIRNRIAVPMTSNDIEDMMTRINYLRSLSNPVASKMNCLDWNSDLAKKAAAYAESCDTAAIENSLDVAFKLDRNKEFYRIFEDSWFSELYFVEKKKCKAGEPRNCKNWKALMNAESDYVGCAQAPCANNEHLYVCVFDKIPKDESFVPYEIGAACSKCAEPKTLCSNETLCCNLKTDTSATSIESSTTASTSNQAQTTTTVSMVPGGMTTFSSGNKNNSLCYDKLGLECWELRRFLYCTKYEDEMKIHCTKTCKFC